MQQNFILVPVNDLYSKEDIEFYIFTEDAVLLGTNIRPDRNAIVSKNIDYDNFIEFIEIKAGEIEAQLKFQNEFKCPMSKYTTLKMRVDEILDLMEYDCGVSSKIVLPLLKKFDSLNINA